MKNNWIDINKQKPNIGDIVLVKGILHTELDDEDTNLQTNIGLCYYNGKGFSCKDYCYYSMWYDNITEWCLIKSKEE